MFRRLFATLPPDPSYPANLNALGYELNTEGQFTRIGAASDDETRFFTFFVTDHERANEVHKEAMHICARKAVLSKLAGLGVRQVYCFGDEGREVGGEKPEGAHVPLLVSEVEKLKREREVVVVVGEHMQDLGVWAYRMLLGKGGIEAGSAVGLATKLKTMEEEPLNEGAAQANAVRTDEAAKRPVIKRNETVGQVATGRVLVEDMIREQLGGTNGLTDSMTNLIISSNTSTDLEGIPGSAIRTDAAPPTSPEAEEEAPASKRAAPGFAPGLIILNPGQLLYSHSEACSMSQATWLARPRRTAIDSAVRIDPVHNTVAGHRSPDQHIRTCLEHILPQLISDDTRVYLVGLSDGSETVVTWLDDKFTALELDENTADARTALIRNIAGVALIEPMHMHSQLSSTTAKAILAHSGRSWVHSGRANGTVLKVPAQLQPAVSALALREEGSGPLSGGEAFDALARSDVQAVVAVPTVQGGQEKEEDPYAKDEVSCVTVSSGVSGVSELIFPAVMDDVLEFFRDLSSACANTLSGEQAE